ncbi:TPA: hypothetical protein N0F65_008299 [Lagenidium giganteum]|uniref:PB1 domain-containing protein n=1 Tax=Lagenidium giganteum TaxID=4803 RepID=A0AAV2YRA2_9STRA|nr:TPA: hypothetical protein N0F65_008299 [Lagenidium giganteum]
MACAEPRLTALKVGYKGEIHRIRIDLSVFKLDDLSNLFCSTFQLTPGSFVIQYKDAEGDCLNVCSEAEYVEACSVFLSSADAVKSLRFVAVPRAHVAFQENVADPILKAIEKLVETLNAAMDKVKQEEWAQRAQSAAQSGMERTNEAFKVAANDARMSFVAAKETIQEIPFDQVMKETAEGIKTAAEGLGAFAQEFVDEIRNMTQPAPATQIEAAEPAAAAPAEAAEAAVEPAEAAEAAVEPASASNSSDSEWEEVAAQTPAPVEETPVVVPEPVVSEEEKKWAAELSLVRDIFPTMETARVIESLEQCNGNVEVVLNALMEEL